MKNILVVGLGNPGDEYSKTRHNIGFMIIDEIVKQNNLEKKTKFNSEYYTMPSNDCKIFFLKPMTYMNNSGDIVLRFKKFFKILTDDILVIYDDKDMDFLKIKYKVRGSSGGHNGIKDIINKLKTEEIKRIKLGINNETNKNTSVFVLKNFSKDEQAFISNQLSEIIYTVESKIKELKDVKLRDTNGRHY